MLKLSLPLLAVAAVGLSGCNSPRGAPPATGLDRGPAARDVPPPPPPIGVLRPRL